MPTDTAVLRAVIQDLLNEAAFHAPIGLADPGEISHDDRVKAEALREYAERLRKHRSIAAAPSPPADRAALIDLLNGLDGELSEEGIGEAFWRIEGNYHRETSGPGSRFEGMMLTTVQARWARSHLIEGTVDRLIAAGVVRTPGHEWQCPGCGATTRARMADYPTHDVRERGAS